MRLSGRWYIRILRGTEKERINRGQPVIPFRFFRNVIGGSEDRDNKRISQSAQITSFASVHRNSCGTMLSVIQIRWHNFNCTQLSIKICTKHSYVQRERTVLLYGERLRLCSPCLICLFQYVSMVQSTL